MPVSASSYLPFGRPVIIFALDVDVHSTDILSAEIVRFSPDTFSRVSPSFSALISLRVSSAPASSFLPVISTLSIETSPSFVSLITTLSTFSPPDVIVPSELILNTTGFSLSEYPRGAVSSISS